MPDKHFLYGTLGLEYSGVIDCDVINIFSFEN